MQWRAAGEVMAAAELYAFWKIAERIGTAAFIVRRCLKRLERGELTIRAATEVLWSYATVTIRTYGSLEELAQLTQRRPHQGAPDQSSECNFDQRLDRSIVRRFAARSKPADLMNGSSPEPRSKRYIVTPSYRGPDRRRR